MTHEAITFGMKAVNCDPARVQLASVFRCKAIFAEAIDQMNDLRNESASEEVKMLASVAITEMQTAQMWAVKALTWED